MSNTPRIIAITGANKGIGLAIINRLLATAPPTPPLVIYLLARDRSRGEAALNEVQSSIKGDHQVKFGQLDVTAQDSIDACKKQIEEEQGKIDVLISNAGIAVSGPRFDSEIVQDAFRVNYFGCKNVIHSLLPLLKKGNEPRIVNVASTAGRSTLIDDIELRKTFTEAESEEAVDKAVEKFKASVAKGTWKEDGYPSVGYGMSKLSLIAYTKVLARLEPSIFCASLCPGYVKTDMAPGGHKTPDMGAKTPVMLAIGDVEGPSGRFWRDERVQDW